MTCRKTRCPIDFRVVVHYARSTGPATQLSARLVRCFSSEFPYTAARTGGQAHESERVLCPKLGKPLLEYLAARRTGRAQALRRSLSLEIVPTGGSGYRLRPMVGWIQRSGPGGWQLPVGALTNASNSDTFTRKDANAFSVMKGVQRHERIAGYLA